MPIEVTFRGMEPSEFVAARARESAEQLLAVASESIGCRVVIETPPGHHSHGQPFHVRIHLMVPGDDIIVDRDPGRGPQAHDDVYVALADAFQVARRRVDELGRKRREERRRHDVAASE